MKRLWASLLGALIAGLLGEGLARLLVAKLPWGDRYHILRADHFTDVEPGLPHYRSTRAFAEADGVVVTRGLDDVTRYGWERPAEGRRVVCLGDSVTESWPESDHISWCDHLSADQTLPLGVGGYNLAQQVAWYRQEFARLQADRFYWQMGPNDIDVVTLSARSGLSVPLSHRWPAHQVLGRNQKTPQMGRSALFWMSSHAWGALWGNRNQKMRVQVDQAALEAILKSLPVPAVAVVLPILSPRHDQQEQDALVEALNAVGMPHIRIDAQTLSAQDPVHPDAVGAKQLARQVADSGVAVK